MNPILGHYAHASSIPVVQPERPPARDEFMSASTVTEVIISLASLGAVVFVIWLWPVWRWDPELESWRRVWCHWSDYWRW